MLRYFTAGESHGEYLIAICEGIPSGLAIMEEDINKQLYRRQQGYGRGERMKIEKDISHILSGIRHGKTIGSPIALSIRNVEWEKWKEAMSVVPLDPGKFELRKVTSPRPGHADLAGAIKYHHQDMRYILERSSARETTSRVATGAIAIKFLSEFGIKIFSHVIEIGRIKAKVNISDVQKTVDKCEKSPVRCADTAAEKKMLKIIDDAKGRGDTVGGIFEVVATNIPPGLGSHVHWDRRLDGRLAMALMSIQAIKGVEIGMGFEAARLSGSKVHDEIFYIENTTNKKTRMMRFYRKTNNAGGLEGGISNGEDIVLRAAMKPIATLRTPLKSVDFITKKPSLASFERSDVCAVPAACVVGEAVVAIEIAKAMLEKFGSDNMDEIKTNFKNYLKYLRRL